MNVFTLIIALLLLVQLSECTLSPPKGKANKRSKGKIESKVQEMDNENLFPKHLCIF